MTKPLLLLQMAEPGPYVSGLQANGVADRVEIAHLDPAAPPDPSLLARAQILVAMNPPPGMLAQMPRLAFIQSLTAGVDHWLARPDLPPSLPLAAARGTHRVQMPENILAGLFHLTKPYTAAVLDQKESRWTRKTGVPLAGQTLAILGLGAIGRELAAKAAALEMRVIGTRRTPDPVTHVAKVLPFEGTDEILGQADFAVLLLPVTPATRDLIDARRLTVMKPTAYLLNFGRGHLIVDDDLVAAIKARTIAGAVLDVFRTEPLPKEHPFWSTPGITVLPHIGGLHPTRDQIVAELLAGNVKRHLAGQPLKELVDRARGY
jgi:glyoxylate/hydroxypyruvate reductase